MIFTSTSRCLQKYSVIHSPHVPDRSSVNQLHSSTYGLSQGLAVLLGYCSSGIKQNNNCKVMNIYDDSTSPINVQHILVHYLGRNMGKGIFSIHADREGTDVHRLICAFTVRL